MISLRNLSFLASKFHVYMGDFLVLHNVEDVDNILNEVCMGTLHLKNS